MKVAEYDSFVARTDQYREQAMDRRRVIALYGLAGEIGSLFSAIKKKLLSEGGQEPWDQPNDEIVEELGDVTWYCFSLAQIENRRKPVNILLNDIALLKREIGGQNERAKKIHAALDPSTKDEFCRAAESFPSIGDLNFDHYQKLAFLTARTRGRYLLEVCMAVLWQLGAELLRETLPEIEITLNKNVADRPVNVVLGEIAWHLCAVASLMNLAMNSVVEKNVEKVNFRANRDKPTSLHDDDRKTFEQLPRRFEVAFVTVGRGRSRRYLRGKRLGDDLTDNAYDDDGYRFHDVLHLANAAHLGWSPVMRKLMSRKRKSRNDQVDEVEDGQRAQIVEELVLKAIHSEGCRLAKETNRCAIDGIPQMFLDKKSITFRFLKVLRSYVEGLEVWKNQYWEWEDAILSGSKLYSELRVHQQGTITVDIDRRTISFEPDVHVELRGATVGLGIGREVMADAATLAVSRGKAAKHAVLDALGLSDTACEDLDLKLVDDRRVCVTARKAVQERMWELNAISFQLAFRVYESTVECTAIAVADINDLT